TQEVGPVLFQQVEQSRVLDQGDLQDLGQSVADVPGVEGRQERAVQQGAVRGEVRAQPVLVSVVVDPGLRADAGVHEADQCGGDADERCGAAVETGGETDDVHEDAPADGDDGFTAAVDAEVVECLGDPQHGVHRLVRLAVVQHEQAVVDGVVIEVGADPLTVQGCDDPVGDDEAA